MMKNNKGFTLVEILVTIVILSVIMVIAYPSVSDAIFTSRKAVNKIVLKNIKDSSEMFAQDVYLCEATTDILNILKVDLKYTSVTNCQKAKEQFKKSITIPIEILEKYDYIAKADKCKGNIVITLNGEKLSNITINTDDIKCTE